MPSKKPTRGRGAKKKAATNPASKKRVDSERGREMEVDYINSLRQRIRDLEDEVAKKDELLSCLERKERRLRIFSIDAGCPDCSYPSEIYAAFVNRKVFTGTDFGKLISRLRGLGYFVKSTEFTETPPKEGHPFDGECCYLEKTLDDIVIPDGVGPGMLEEEDR